MRKLIWTLMLIVLSSGCIHATGNYYLSGQFKGDIPDDFYNAMNAFNIEISILEIWPPQFQVSDLSEGTCKKLRNFLLQKDYLRSVGECRERTSIETPTDTVVQNNEQQTATSEYTGNVLAGSASKVYDFEKADYDKALNSDKLVVLYFYANWCPICRAEVPKMYAAFNELTTDEVIGFRVNYNDGNTDDFEEALAKQYGVPYQHTKIFVRNNEVVLKSLEEWNKDKYLEEIQKALG